MADTHKNFAKGTLTNSPGTAGTSFILGAGEGALFAANMPVTIVADQTQPDSSNAEIGYVTAVSTDTLTVTRAQQSTAAQNAVAGWLVLGTITAKALTDIEADVATKASTTYVDSGDTAAKARANHTGTQTAATISDFSVAADARITAATGVSVQAYDPDLTTWAGKTAPSGTVVGTSDTQTLTNKTLTTPKLGSAGYIADANGNEILKTSSTVVDAINEITISNAAMTDGPTISATGDDTDIDIVLLPKGAGRVSIPSDHGLNITRSLTTIPTPGVGTGTIAMEGAGATTRPKFINSSGTLETLSTTSATETLTNKTIALGSNTVSGTTAQFNTANTDGDFATLAGTETLSNKTLTTPKLGSAGFIADVNGNEVLKTSATVASAVNEVTITNAATAGDPTLSATGGDTNINLGLAGKGTGSPVVSSTNGFGIVGSASTPSTPATSVGKFAMAGTSAVRPRFINSGGTVETVLTDTTQTSLGYAQRTSDFNSSSTTPVQLTDLSTTVTIPAGGRRIKITAHVTTITASAITTPTVTIWDGTVGSGTQVGQSRAPTIPTSGYFTGAVCMAVVTPSAGSKTYNVGVANTAGTNTTYAAAATAPMFILVEPI